MAADVLHPACPQPLISRNSPFGSFSAFRASSAGGKKRSNSWATREEGRSFRPEPRPARGPAVDPLGVGFVLPRPSRSRPLPEHTVHGRRHQLDHPVVLQRLRREGRRHGQQSVEGGRQLPALGHRRHPCFAQQLHVARPAHQAGDTGRPPDQIGSAPGHLEGDEAAQ